MSEIEQLRKEVSELRERVAALEQYNNTHYAPVVVGPRPIVPFPGTHPGDPVFPPGTIISSETLMSEVLKRGNAGR